MPCRHGLTYHAALDMLLLSEATTEPRSEGRSYVTCGKLQPTLQLQLQNIPIYCKLHSE